MHPSRFLRSFPASPLAFAGFFGAAACTELFALHGPRGGGSPKLTAWQWIMARVYHELVRSGTFAANVKTLTQVTISDSALSQRAMSIGWQLIDEILQLVLRPLADPVRHAGAFHRGYRLLAFDGTRFNLRNTPAINAGARKTACSKGGGVPAFAHLLGVVLDELEHPAAGLVELYATRWEEELFFRELKSHLHGRDNLLDAQTPETAAQEVLAILVVDFFLTLLVDVIFPAGLGRRLPKDQPLISSSICGLFGKRLRKKFKRSIASTGR